MSEPSEPGHAWPTPSGGLRRRDVLRALMAAGIGGGAGLAGGLAVAGATRADEPETTVDEPADAGSAPLAAVPVPAHGTHQAGIDAPATPQPHGALAVVDLVTLAGAGASADPGYATLLRRLCAELGRTITALTSGQSVNGGRLLDGPGNLTVTVGLGPRLVAALDPRLPGADHLPAFARDDAIPPGRVGGDILLAAYSSDPNAVATSLRVLTGQLPGASIRWTQRCFRAPGTGTVARNPLGFHDGVIVPRGADALADNVWIPNGPMAGGSICVVRRLRLDTAAFDAEPTYRQEEIIGRRRGDGAPLSGGGPSDEADLLAKTPDGHYLTPARSHVRAAHPSFTGSHLMLRRGYAFDDGMMADAADAHAADAGLLFICFQRDLRTFVQTQHRLDEVDDLMRFVTPTASGTFLILPGFDDDRPLGATLP